MSANIEASLRLEIAQYQASMAKARGDITKLKDHAKREGAGLGGNLFGGLRSALGGLLPAMGAAAVVGGVKSIMNGMDDLADTALRLNESTETLQRVEYASQILAGVDLNGVTTSFLKLEKSIGDVENAAANKALERYGISAESLARMPLDEKMIALAEAFQTARADGTGYNDLLALLGKSGGDLIPLLEQSGQTLRDTFADAPVVLDATVQRMAAMNDQVDGFIAKQKSQVADFIGQGLMMADEILDPNKSLGDNTKAAAAGADKAVSEEQKKRDKAAEALAEAAAQQKVAAATEQQLDTRKELNKIAEKESALGEKRYQDYLSILPPNLKLIELQREQLKLEAARDIQGPGLDGDRISTEEKLIALAAQQRDAKKEITDQEVKTADEVKKAAEEQAGKDQSLGGFEAEMALIDAKLAKDKDLTAELERQAAILEQQLQLMESAGLSADDALSRATNRVDKEADLKKQMDKEKGGRYDADGRRADGRKKIDARIKGDGNDARQRAEDRGNLTQDRTASKREKMGGLEAEDSRLKNRMQKEFGRPQPPGLADQARKNAAGGSGLANQAQKNAQKEGPQAADNTTAQLGQQMLAILQQMLPSMQ